MTALVEIARGFWVELFHGYVHPTDEVKTNIRLVEEAIYLAKRLQKESPEYNERVLIEAARLLGSPRIKLVVE